MKEFPGQFDRRSFIASAGATAFALALPTLPAETVSTKDDIIVSPNGADDAPGSLSHPVRTLDRALALSRAPGRSTILLRAGTYELAQPLHITAANAPHRIAGYAQEEAILSGGTRLQLDWRPYRDGIFQATVPSGTTTDQLFINHRRQVLTRYPNFDANARYLNGFAADAISPERAAPSDSEDIVRRNIVFAPYRPIRPEAWGKEIDFNLLHHPGMLKPQPAVSLQKLSGQDAHSLEGDAHFLDLEHGNFTVHADSPAIKLGFKNIPVHEYGVRSPRLRALARTPDILRLLQVHPVSLEKAVPV